MKRIFSFLSVWALAFVVVPAGGQLSAQQALTWDQVKARFEATNPALKADADSVDEMRAEEVTAYLRPNPQIGLTEDGNQIVPHDGVWQPLRGADVQPNVSYLHERDHKRELRLESAREGTRISESQHEDLRRNLEFTLRSAFVQTLEAKDVLELAQDDLDVLRQDHRHQQRTVEGRRHRANRLRSHRSAAGTVRIRAANGDRQSADRKDSLLQLLDDRTPVDQFDVDGTFDFSDSLDPLDTFRDAALAARPDLQAALETIQQSETNHKLAVSNGSTDPTFSAWYTWNSSNNNPNGLQTIGASVNIPLRIFDRNQGEKKRTEIDIERSREASEAARAQVFSDVDTAYELVRSNIALLKPYKAKYNDEALRVRDTVTYAYQHGGASLMDFLNAQSDFRQVQLAYAQLIGAYLTAAGQLNLAVGREVIP